jgi:hypothetical protein
MYSDGWVFQCSVKPLMFSTSSATAVTITTFVFLLFLLFPGPVFSFSIGRPEGILLNHLLGSGGNCWFRWTSCRISFRMGPSNFVLFFFRFLLLFVSLVFALSGFLSLDGSRRWWWKLSGCYPSAAAALVPLRRSATAFTGAAKARREVPQSPQLFGSCYHHLSPKISNSLGVPRGVEFYLNLLPVDAGQAPSVPVKRNTLFTLGAGHSTLLL